MTALDAHMKAHSISDISLARKVRCDRSMITKIRGGKATPSLPLALRISHETGISPEALSPVSRETPSPTEAA